jgi:hypothetical protein
VLAPWHLTLGALDELQPSIAFEPGDRLALHLSSSNEWPELPSLRVAMVQPGRQIELYPLHAPARSLPLPNPMAPLDDLWLLVRTATRRYWFEVPYGVCGAPGDREREGEPQVGPPRPPPGEMLDDIVVPWRAIRFELGRANGSQLEVIATSARPGEIELAVHRPDPGPPPELAISVSGGELSCVEPWRASGATPEHLHFARYAFVPEPVPQAPRAYRRLQVSRGSASIELSLPTSLTDPVHRSAARHRIAHGA